MGNWLGWVGISLDFRSGYIFWLHCKCLWGNLIQGNREPRNVWFTCRRFFFLIQRSETSFFKRSRRSLRLRINSRDVNGAYTVGAPDFAGINSFCITPHLVLKRKRLTKLCTTESNQVSQLTTRVGYTCCRFSQISGTCRVIWRNFSATPQKCAAVSCFQHFFHPIGLTTLVVRQTIDKPYDLVLGMSCSL